MKKTMTFSLNNEELAEKMQSMRIKSIKNMVSHGLRRVDAEDIFHDAVADYLMMSSGRREGVGSFESFLFGTLRNKKNSFFRKPKSAFMFDGEDSGARMTYVPCNIWIDDEEDYVLGEDDAYDDRDGEDDNFDDCNGKDDNFDDCNGKDDDFGDVIDDVFDNEDYVVRKKIVDDLLKDLKPQERKLIDCLFSKNEKGKKKSFKEIARELGFKNAAVVSTTKNRLLDKLKFDASQALKKYYGKMRMAS